MYVGVKLEKLDASQLTLYQGKRTQCDLTLHEKKKEKT